MTEKRFNRVGGYVYDGDKCISHFEDVTHRDDIVKLLNELHEENEQLKQEIDMLSCELSVSANKTISRDCIILELADENEQLKQQMQSILKLTKKIEDYIHDIKIIGDME